MRTRPHSSSGWKDPASGWRWLRTGKYDGYGDARAASGEWPLTFVLCRRHAAMLEVQDFTENGGCLLLCKGREGVRRLLVLLDLGHL